MIRRMILGRRIMLTGLGGAVAGSLLAGRAQAAGALEPPPGPIGPTPTSLDELDAEVKKAKEEAKLAKEKAARTPEGFAEPRLPLNGLPGSATAMHVISESGSYYLTGNLEVPAGLDGIEFATDNADLDLCGFHVISIRDTTPPTKKAMKSKVDAKNLTVYNGSLIGWGTGVDFRLASQAIIEDITVIGAAVAGLVIGDASYAFDCEVHGSPGVGISAPGRRSLIEECSALSCGTGFSVGGSQNLLLSNTATDCGSPFEIAPGNSHGPIATVVGVGDISTVPGGTHPDANLIH